MTTGNKSMNPSKVTNKGAAQFIQRREEFRASNMTGRIIPGGYAVLSYGWYPLFVWRDGVWYSNKEKYSKTTSAHYTLAHPGEDTQPRTTAQLNAMIVGQA